MPFKAWMFGIIRNTCIDRHRRRKMRLLEDPLDDDQSAARLDSPLYSIPLAPEDIVLREEAAAGADPRAADEHSRAALRGNP